MIRAGAAILTLACSSLGQQPERQPEVGIEHTMAWLAGHANRPPSVGTAAWMIEAMLANGSTMRVGPHKNPVKLLTVYLRNAQKPSGEYVIDDEPCSRTEQLLATCAMADNARLSKYSLLRRNVQRGARAALHAFAGEDAAPASVHEHVLLLVLADRLDALGGMEQQAGECRELARAAAAAFEVGADRRTDAALHLASILQGEDHPPELTIARAWPADLHADPLHSWYGAFALRGTSPAVRRTQAGALAKLREVRVAEGRDSGSWPAGGELDALTTTAMLAAVHALVHAKR